ncbi:MAG: amidohydrolase family protein [Anaerovoracaceae bacterium]|nr:amidohydrolase family protein [Bacillota bacterium]MEE0516881.1 amidohydrolase family protein [Anaerovoracaceae bacterium]
MKDLKIVNAKFPDFKSNDWIEADILIHDGKIEKIGDVSEECKEVIDASGKVVSPGFIDIHAHEDEFKGNREDDFFTAQRGLLMGVTTEIVGNCGDMYNSPETFVNRIDKEGAPVNYMTFIGQNYLREQAGAMDRYKASTVEQLDKMKMMLAATKKYGPVGLSCGFEYAPGVTSEETVNLAKALDEEGYLISVHFREDGPKAPDSTRELIEISKATGYGIEMSHIGSCAAVGYMDETLNVIKEARDAGVDISTDCYPYNAFCTGIGTAVFDEGCFERWGKTYSDILVLDGPYVNQRCNRELFEKLKKEDPDLHVAVFAMNREEVDKAFATPFVMVGSDCGFVNRHGHPRGAGAFPKVIREYVREKKMLTLMEALRKMTVMPAERVKLKYKGEIKEGNDADIVIFDENNIADGATFENPTEAPKGIDYVIVNGHIAAEAGVVKSDNCGKYIRYKNR